MPRTVASSYTHGFLTAVPGYASSISYHPNGQVDQVTRANNVVDTYFKDPFNMARPNKIDAKLGTTIIWNGGFHSYDGAGNMTRAGNAYFVYDRVSRIKNGLLYLGPGAGGATRSFDHAFDGFGNLQSLTANGALRNTPTSASTNRLTGSVGYDAAGNLVSWNGNTYQYDRLGMMTRMAAGSEIWLYMYDADDERVWAFKEGANPRFDRWTLRDLDGKVLRTYEATGYVWSWSEDHVHRGGTLLASVTPSGTTHLHTDHLGTPRASTNASGTRTAYHVYYPFGEEATSITQDTQRMKFTGHERDLGNLSSAADDLDYMHARFYNPQTGRFLSTDPRPQRRSLTSSLFWNRYGYSAGNPLRYVDPDGRCAVPAGLKEGQVGICIEAFIAANRVGGIGFGDNRTFARNDPNAAARISYKAIIDPQSGTILRENLKPGVTKVGLTRGTAVGLPGTAEVAGGSATTESGTRFSIHLSGKNAFATINRLGAIGVLADFTVDRSGNVERGEASATKGYPSVEGYSYRIVQGELVIEALYRFDEKTTKELDGPIDEPLSE